MPDFPRLPWPVRVVRVLGPLCLLSACLLVGSLVGPILSTLSLDSWRILTIALNLFILALTYFAINHRYRAGIPPIPQPDMGPVPLTSWQKQARAVALWTALPLCALALAIFIPVTSRAFQFVFPVSILAAVMAGVVGLIAWESRRSIRVPRAL